MKMMTVEIIKDDKSGQLQVAGRCCRDSICIGDELEVKGMITTKVQVTAINVYNKMVDCLHHGYVGTLFVTLVSGEVPPLDSVLVDNSQVE